MCLLLVAVSPSRKVQEAGLIHTSHFPTKHLPNTEVRVNKLLPMVKSGPRRMMGIAKWVGKYSEALLHRLFQVLQKPLEHKPNHQGCHWTPVTKFDLLQQRWFDPQMLYFVVLGTQQGNTSPATGAFTIYCLALYSFSSLNQPKQMFVGRPSQIHRVWIENLLTSNMNVAMQTKHDSS